MGRGPRRGGTPAAGGLRGVEGLREPEGEAELEAMPFIEIVESVPDRDISLPGDSDLAADIARIEQRSRDFAEGKNLEPPWDETTSSFRKEMSRSALSRINSLRAALPQDRKLTSPERLELEHALVFSGALVGDMSSVRKIGEWRKELDLPEDTDLNRVVLLHQIKELASFMENSEEGRELLAMWTRGLGGSAPEDLVRYYQGEDMDLTASTLRLLAMDLAGRENAQARTVRSWIEEDLEEIRNSSELGGRRNHLRPLVCMPEYTWMLEWEDRPSGFLGATLPSALPGNQGDDLVSVFPKDLRQSGGSAIVNGTYRKKMKAQDKEDGALFLSRDEIRRVLVHEMIHDTQGRKDNSDHLPKMKKPFVEGMTEGLALLRVAPEGAGSLADMQGDIVELRPDGSVRETGDRALYIAYPQHVARMYMLLRRAGVRDEEMADRLQYLNGLSLGESREVLAGWLGDEDVDASHLMVLLRSFRMSDEKAMSVIDEVIRAQR